MRRKLSIIKPVCLALYAALAIGAAALVLPQTGLKALSVETPSMAPAIPPGSLVLIKRTPAHTLKSGDVITFSNPADGRSTITHRITETKTKSGAPAFITKGDANPAPDREVMGGNVVGQVIWHAPKLGALDGLLRHPLGLGAFVYLPSVLIVMAELDRLLRVLREEAAAHATQLGNGPLRPQWRELSGGQRPSRVRTRRMVDSVSLRPLAAVAAAGVLSFGSTYASLNDSATLTGNTISTRVVTPPLPGTPTPPLPGTPATGLLISRVFTGQAPTAGCAQPQAGVAISNTGPNSNSRVGVNSNCRISIDQSTNVRVDNSTRQNSTSENVTNRNNTSGGGATSGSASNSSSTTTNITIGGNQGNVPRSQSVQLHNPTTQTINLAGWQLVDNSGTARTIASGSIAPGATVTISAGELGGLIGNGLEGAGDRLILRNPAGVVSDAISWGSDLSQLSPSIAPIPAGGAITRKAAGIDTGAAGDWQIVGP